MEKFGSRILAFVIGTAFVFSAAVAFADDPEGTIATMSIGTYGPADVPSAFAGDCATTPGGQVDDSCVGELVTCATDEAFSPINQTYYYIRGICDDREANGLPACAGRYVAYGEECSRPFDDEHRRA